MSNHITILPNADRNRFDLTAVFRVDHYIPTSHQSAPPSLNMRWADALRYAQHLADTGRYSRIRIGLDTF